MRFNLRVTMNDELLRDLREYFHIDGEIVRRDLQEALTRTVLIYEHDVARLKRANSKKRGKKA